MVPLGGFVSLEGEDGPGDPNDPGNFNNKPARDRLKVILAGCFMNYVAGILLLLVVGFIWGVAIINPPAVIGSLTPGYPLERAGMQVNDRILEVNGQKITGFVELSELISPMKDGTPVSLLVERDKKVFTCNLKVKYDEKYKRGMLGFSAKSGMLAGFTFIKVTPVEVLQDTLLKTALFTVSPILMVQKLITREISVKEVKEGSAGPIGIGQMIFDLSKKGTATILFTCAFLSILIGAFNLIPFPALDGSRAVFIVLEMIRKKPIDSEKEGIIHQIGFIILIILVIIISYQDILRLIRGQSLFR